VRPCPHTFRTLVAGAIMLVLAACTSTTSHGTPETTAGSGSSTLSASPLVPGLGGTKSLSPYCTKLRDAGLRIQHAEVELYTSGTGQSSAVSDLVSELNGLKSGAPDEIKSALSDLAKAFQSAQVLLAHPASGNTSALASIGSKLATDAQQVTRYIASKC